jgi:hypothetical protein
MAEHRFHGQDPMRVGEGLGGRRTRRRHVEDHGRLGGHLTAIAFHPGPASPVERQAFQASVDRMLANVDRHRRGLMNLQRIDRAMIDRAFALIDTDNLIVTAGKDFIVDAWQNIVELETMKFHGVGLGTVAATVADTALGTESTTILNPDSTRATGSLTEGSTAEIFRSVGTVTFDGSGAITEWGLFNQAATGGGTMFSRVVYAAINVANLDSVVYTWDLTVS